MTATLIRHYNTASKMNDRERRIRNMRQTFRTKMSRRKLKQNMREIIHQLHLV